MAKKIDYSEPTDYIPKDIRKKLGLGEFAKTEKPNEDDKKKRENEELKHSKQICFALFDTVERKRKNVKYIITPNETAEHGIKLALSYEEGDSKK